MAATTSFGIIDTSNISTESILNKVFDSTNNALQASITGTIGAITGNLQMGSATVDAGTFLMIMGAQTSDPQFSIVISSDANGDVVLESDTGDMGVSTPNGSFWGDPLNDQMSYMLAGDYLDITINTVGLWEWITPATTEQDLSPHNHDATYNGTMTTGDQLQKGLVWILDLDGTDDYLSVSDSADFTFDDAGGANGFTIYAWVEIDTTGNDLILGKYNDNTPAREYRFYLSSGKPTLLLFDESVDKFPFTAADDALTNATWYFLTVVYDGGGGATAASGITMYVNGVSVASTANNDASYVGMEDLGADVTMGANIANGGGLEFVYTGDLGSVGITRDQLTADQVWEMYVRTRGKYNL